MGGLRFIFSDMLSERRRVTGTYRRSGRLSWSVVLFLSRRRWCYSLWFLWTRLSQGMFESTSWRSSGGWVEVSSLWGTNQISVWTWDWIRRIIYFESCLLKCSKLNIIKLGIFPFSFQMRQNRLKNKIEKILTWRWSHQLKGQDEVDHTMSPEKRKRVVLLSYFKLATNTFQLRNWLSQFLIRVPEKLTDREKSNNILKSLFLAWEFEWIGERWQGRGKENSIETSWKGVICEICRLVVLGLWMGFRITGRYCIQIIRKRKNRVATRQRKQNSLGL